MSPIDAIVEERIGEAMRRGEFTDLPGTGKPLELNDDPLVPEDVRVINRVLKNAGFAPPEILDRREISALEAHLPAIAAVDERSKAIAKLAALRTRLGGESGRRLFANRRYTRRIFEKLSGTAIGP
ncbi:MAG: DUF1992 domain-containing protein [Betaproteobacteria bacterium]|nr:DUF1992 domain-containing protein [Betaproteobacteria bacterium]